MFPDEYEGQLFIALHGSWNRSVPIGYELMRVKLDGSTPVAYEPFAEGWLQSGDAWGRPVDVIVLPDGSMLVSDDKLGVIYRITYSG
jgi:glucose/arabinose dehydrogenase